MIDENNPDHIGETQANIRGIAAGFIPLEISLPMIPEELRQPCTDLYNFFNAVLDNMYQDAEEYKTDYFFFWYFVWLYKKFKFYDDTFTANISEYKKFTKKHSSPKIEALFSRHGMEYKNDYNITGECIKITNSRYPGMMKAIFELLTAAYQNYNVNCTSYLFTCDFRALANFKRAYNDMFSELNDDGKERAEHIVAFAAGIGVKPSKNTYFSRVEFKKKSKIIFILDVADGGKLKINIGFAEIGGEAFKLIEKEIEKYDDLDEFKDFWRKHYAKKCKNCRTECYHKSNPIEVFGKKTIICGRTPYIRMYAPDKLDLKYIFRLIELRLMVINAGISEPFYPGNG